MTLKWMMPLLFGWVSHVHAHLQIDVYIAESASGSHLAKRVSITDNVVRIDRFDQPRYVLYKLNEHTLYTIHHTAHHYSKMLMHFEESVSAGVQKNDFERRVDVVQKAKFTHMLNELVDQKNTMTQRQYQATLDAIANLQLEFFGVDSISNDIVYIKRQHGTEYGVPCQYLDVVHQGHKIGSMCVVSIEALGVTAPEYQIFSKVIGFMREIDQSLISDYLLSEGKGFLPIVLHNEVTKEKVRVDVIRVETAPAFFDIPATYKMLQ